MAFKMVIKGQMVRSSGDCDVPAKPGKDSFLSPSYEGPPSRWSPLPSPPVLPSPLSLVPLPLLEISNVAKRGDLEVSLSLIFE